MQLTFRLPAASYATMLIRELLKTSTSQGFHKGLSLEAAERGGEAAGRGD